MLAAFEGSIALVAIFSRTQQYLSGTDAWYWPMRTGSDNIAQKAIPGTTKMTGLWWKAYGRWSRQPWLSTDAGLTEGERWQILGATFLLACNYRMLAPLRRRFYWLMPHRLALLRLELLGNPIGGSAWYRIRLDRERKQVRRTTNHLDDVQRPATRGHVKLHAGCPMLLDRHAQLLAVDADEDGGQDLIEFRDAAS